jgi:predicted TIM-barrel fold metal-dependent hydrolase
VERIKEQDMDGVDAEVMYPTPRLCGAVWGYKEDPEFHLAMVQAYNSWLSEYCSYEPDRMLGMAEMPTTGIDVALAELDRATKLPGMRGVVLGQWPNGSLDLKPEDDRFWAACVELGWTVNIHVSFTRDIPVGGHTAQTAAPAGGGGSLPGDTRFTDAPVRVNQLIASGVFDRFPALQVVFPEVDCGWVPYYREQLDDRYKRIHHFAEIHLPKAPSEYFYSNLSWSYITDTYGLKNRHEIGVNNILWSSDYPHLGADWPHSWRVIEEVMTGIPEDEKAKILAGNAVRLYHLPHDPAGVSAYDGRVDAAHA